MRSLSGKRIFSFCMVASAFAVYAQAPTPQQDLQRISVATALDREGMPAWHLRMSFDLYDLHGAKKESGTIEEWWVSAHDKRVVIQSPSYSAHAHDRTAYLENLLLQQVVHPIQRFGDFDKLKVIEQNTKLSKVPLTCLFVIQPGTNGDEPVLGDGTQMCVQPQTNILRVQFDSGQFTDVRNRMGNFLNTSVALDNALSFAGKTAIVGHVDVLETFTPPATEKAPSEAPAREKLAGVVLAGKVLKKQPPIYPEVARERHISGSVVLTAIISKEGTITSLDVVSTPDQSLSNAAVDAVKQWTYLPYLLNGQPTEVDTTITVNFKLNSY